MDNLLDTEYFSGRKDALKKAIDIIYEYFSETDENGNMKSSFALCNILQDEIDQIELPIKYKVILNPDE